MSQKRNQNKKVAVGLSGGVDSAVAAYLLKKQGYEVTGVFMQCWQEPPAGGFGKSGGCKADEDRVDAVKAASRVGIKFKSLDFIKEYKKRVISHFYNEYRAGRTPNPDVLCNKEIKFGLFLDWAKKKKFDYVATGHYARIVEENGTYKLLKGVDGSKDQSYFLYTLAQEQLKDSLFPLGEMTKKEVRKLAKEVGLHNWDRPDSQGICFIGEVDIKKFLQREIEPKKGYVLAVNGKVVGEHGGVWFYTIGQRHGFSLKKYFGVPVYVVGKNTGKNELIVGFGRDCLREFFEVEDVYWIFGEPKFPLECGVRIRHLGGIFQGTFSPPRVVLREPIFGVAPGQSAVFYDGDVVLGGGIIS